MRARNLDLLNVWALALALLIRAGSFGLNTDGVLLLSFKYSITADPFLALQGWSADDETPCSWNGVSCGAPGSGEAYFRVTGLSLPDSGLRGSLPSTIGMIQHLQNLNLSNNSINGSIPSTLFSAAELQFFDLSNNLLSGTLPELVGKLQNLRLLNLSDNALVGSLPLNLTAPPNLTAVFLQNNYFFGPIPAKFDSIQVLDLSSNLINGTLPPDFGGSHLSYFNVSYNRLSGEIPPQFASLIPANATVDLSHNNLSGPIPASDLFSHQSTDSLSGNPNLCGQPLQNTCPAPSPSPTPAGEGVPPSNSPPAIAAIPKTIASNPSTGDPSHEDRSGLTTRTILAIVIGDIAGIAILAIIFLYIFKRKKFAKHTTKPEETANEFDWASSESTSAKRSCLRKWTFSKKPRHHNNADADDDDSESTSNSTESGKQLEEKNNNNEDIGALVTVDGEKELEVETLLKASAYILGASGSSIMYKAVLEDGTTLAVRRVGENGVERFKDFETQIRVIAKLVHPNLVRIRGFYWGPDEKLVIYDFLPNGSLANARYKKAGCSPCPLPWEMRLRIAKGVARGLSYIHEKKHVHGNLKPSNILLGPDMEPKIGDMGLERLLTGDNAGSRAGGSARNFGSKRSTASRESFQELATPSPSSSAIGLSPYHAPESLRSIKPHPKWDVFSFGVVLLELLTGKVVVSDETGPGLAILSSTSADDDKGKILRAADVAIRAELEGKEDALLVLLRLGYSCISPMPQKRPQMKEALQILERFPICSFS
ncbi:probable LRR receptor-like serine/threonine-protein kinase At4g37250 [Salvia hispanica]|uniref:probable LRR receptor-like serine/threonine-protein kinase At4g37250 n=1 Tax=Salvia hispanica TaxID=49212 RepID=UPI0020097EF9|nr:probable LRR receptor-like serine/threonine-protein kinase At4g37250 [Salvia hispanica]